MDFLAYAHLLGLTESNLDDLVYSVAQGLEVETLNSVSGEADQERHIDAVERAASSVNNDGLAAQLDFLAEHMDDDDLRDALAELA